MLARNLAYLLLIGAIALSGCSTGKRSILLYSGKEKIGVEQFVKTHQDMWTGRDRKTRSFRLTFNRKPISEDQLLELIDTDELSKLKISDAMVMDSNDVLLIVRGEYNEPFLPVRLRFIEGQLSAEILPMGALAHPYFLDSRYLYGWTRLQARDNGHQYFIRHKPFTIVELGRGTLPKVDYPHAFMVNPYQEGLHARVVDLETGDIVAELSHPEDCFRLPDMDFDVPHFSTLAYGTSSNTLHYFQGRGWWEHNFDFQLEPHPRLTLRPTHNLPVPSAQYLGINLYYDRERPSGISPRLTGYMSGSEYDETIGYVRPDCSKVNPRAFAAEKENQPYAKSVVTPAEFCLLDQEHPIDPAEKQKRCGAVTRKAVHQQDQFVIHELNFKYYPQQPELHGESISYRLYEIEEGDWRTLRFRWRNESHRNYIAIDVIAVSPDVTLIPTVDSSGAGLFAIVRENGKSERYWLGGASDNPAYEWSSDRQFIYLRSSGRLYRMEPFTSFYYPDLVALQGQQGVSVEWYADEGWQTLEIVDLSGCDCNNQLIRRIRLPVSCLTSPAYDYLRLPLHQTQEWFFQNFEWDEETAQIRLKVRDGVDERYCKIREVEAQPDE